MAKSEPLWGTAKRGEKLTAAEADLFKLIKSDPTFAVVLKGNLEYGNSVKNKKIWQMIRSKFVTLKNCPGAIRAAPKGESSALKQIRDKVNEKFKDYIVEWDDDTHWPLVKEHLPALAEENPRHVWVRLVNKIASLCGGKSPPTQPIKNKMQGAEKDIKKASRVKAAVRDEPWFTEPMFEFLCQRITKNEKKNKKSKGKPATKQHVHGGGSTATASPHSGSASKQKSTTRAPLKSSTRKSLPKEKATGAPKSKQPPPADNMMECGSSPSELAISPAPLEGRALSVDSCNTGSEMVMSQVSYNNFSVPQMPVNYRAYSEPVIVPHAALQGLLFPDFSPCTTLSSSEIDKQLRLLQQEGILDTHNDMAAVQKAPMPPSPTMSGSSSSDCCALPDSAFPAGAEASWNISTHHAMDSPCYGNGGQCSAAPFDLMLEVDSHPMEEQFLLNKVTDYTAQTMCGPYWH
eukprot:jgi/Tetstr1/454510/TSEL_041409.t1